MNWRCWLGWHTLRIGTLDEIEQIPVGYVQCARCLKLFRMPPLW